MMTEEEHDAIVIRDGDVTAVHIEIQLPPDGARTLQATGTARRHPDDRPDERIGTSLAYARALDELARQAHEYAEDRIAGGHIARRLTARAVSDQVDALMRMWSLDAARLRPGDMFRVVDNA